MQTYEINYKLTCRLIFFMDIIFPQYAQYREEITILITPYHKLVEVVHIDSNSYYKYYLVT
jgi:hypothetical protein